MNALVNTIHIKTMSSREIATLTGKEHFHVKRDIEKMCLELNLDASKFGCIYFDQHNREQTEYKLDKELTTTLITGYSIKLRNAVIKRWQELEQQVTAPRELTRIEILTMAIESEQKAIALQAQVAVLEPKAAALDTIANAEGTHTLTDAAKVLGVQPKKTLIPWLSANGWIFQQSGDWHPYQSRITQGLLTSKVRTYQGNSGEQHTTVQTRVTAKGMALLAQRMGSVAA